MIASSKLEFSCKFLKFDFRKADLLLNEIIFHIKVRYVWQLGESLLW